jgi:3-mercaptopyruvate sulfurtransferase SseA
MTRSFVHRILLALALGLSVAAHAAAEGPRGNLVSAQWLAKNLGSADLVIVDASPGHVHAAKHIPGAVQLDAFSSMARELAPAMVEKRIQSLGISPGKKVVVYDPGGTWFAPRIFFDLYEHGFPAEDLFILDGGLAQWEKSGGAVTKDATPAPARGTFRISGPRDVRARLPEFLLASGDRANHVLLDALDAKYHYGETKFFDRAGHVPHSVLMPAEDFFNADKTFKSAEEIRRLAGYLGIVPEKQVNAYCGGGGAAAVPFFALRFVAAYPKVKLYSASVYEWLSDDRGLPTWTYAAPFLKRDMDWVQGWGGGMLRMFGLANMSLVDVRPADSYAQGHVPFAVSIPAEKFRAHLGDSAKLAEILGRSGVSAGHEAVVVSDGGLNPGSALAFLALESLGQKRVSVLMESLVDWGMKGGPTTKEPTTIGRPKSPQDHAVPPATYVPNPRAGIVIRDPGHAQGAFPQVFLASGKQAPAARPGAKVIHVPYTEFLDADGSPKAAKDIWKVLDKAGVPRYAEIILTADDPGEAAVNYYILRLMGFPDIKVLIA